MGMYTGVRFKAIIKEGFRDVIDSLMNDEDVNCWECVLAKYEKMEFASDFIHRPRSSGIPFGSLAYMPDEWEELIDPKLGDKWDNYKHVDGWEKEFNKDTGYWQFQCSLKNYDGEIESFFKVVVPVIVEKVIHIEKYYEEDRYGRIYNLVNGELVEDEKLKVDYEPWMDDERCYY